MSNIVLPDCISIFRVAALSALGNVKPLVGSITVDRYDYAYVAYNGPSDIVLVTKAIPPMATTIPVRVTVTGSSNGNPLAPLNIDFDLTGPVDPDPATSIQITNGPQMRDKIGYPVPVDGGQTIPLQ